MGWLDQVKWDVNGLAPVITQEYKTKQVLTLAWVNREALRLTVETGHAVYWSRSRQKIWHKGEQSGNQQLIKSIRLDCDYDAILIEVEQMGGIACHTGRHHCFYKKLALSIESDPIEKEWKRIESVLKDPKEIYK